ncbi:MAG: Fibronectin-attachment protein (FAP), partial [bacterium]
MAAEDRSPEQEDVRRKALLRLGVAGLVTAVALAGLWWLDQDGKKPSVAARPDAIPAPIVPAPPTDVVPPQAEPPVPPATAEGVPPAPPAQPEAPPPPPKVSNLPSPPSPAPTPPRP